VTSSPAEPVFQAGTSVAAAVYFGFLRRWHLNWEATPEEASGEVAGELAECLARTQSAG
jgi:hypothetical protein